MVIDDPFAPAAKPKRRTSANPAQRMRDLRASRKPRVYKTIEQRQAESEGRARVRINPIKYRERTEMNIRAHLRTHTREFAWTYFGYEMYPFHIALLDGLFEGGMREYLLPTEHAKTTYGAIIYPVCSLAESGGEARHIVGATNEREARVRVKAIKTILEANPNGLTDTYPWMKRAPNKPWTVSELWVQGASWRNINPSVTALGRGASDMKSRRAKTVFDDLEGINESLTQGERDKLWRWLTLEGIRVFEDPELFERPLLALLGTPYSPDSLYFRAQRAGFRVYKQPYRYPNGELIWPAKRRKIAALKRSLSTTPGAFEIAMKLDPQAADPDSMSFEEIREKSQAEATRFDESVGHFKYTVLDPAGGSENKRVDYAGIAHVKIRWPRVSQLLKNEGLDDLELPWVEVYEPRAYKHGVISQVKLVQQIRAKYGGPVIYETNGPQRMTYRRLFEAFAPECVLIEHNTSQYNRWDKHMGMGVVGEISKAGRLKVFGREHFDTDESDEDADLYEPGDVDELIDNEVIAGGDVRDPGVRSLLYEIRDLGDPKAHNHIVAGIWFAVRHSWEQRRRGGQDVQQPNRLTADAFRDRTEMILDLRYGASYPALTGYGGGRIIDLRPYKGGVARG